MKREDVSSSRAKNQPGGQVAPGGEQSSGMVERVARAIYGSSGGLFPEACQFAARAAIEAMREPTEAMVRAAIFRGDAVATYLAVIDAALSEPQ